MARNVLFIESNTDGTVGGSHVCLLDLVRRLDRSRFNPVVLFYEDNSLVEDFRAAGAKVLFTEGNRLVRLPFAQRGNGLLRLPLQVCQKGLNLFWGVVLPTLRFARLYREHAIGLVHHNNCFQAASEHALAAVLTGIPCLSHQRIRSDQLPPLTLLTRFTSRLVKAVICVSEHVRESVVRGGFPAERCCVIHDGLDGSAFRARIWRTPAEVRAEFGLPLGAPIILMVGNIKAWKGQMTVVKAAALLKDRYPEAVTIFVGDVSKSPLDAPYLAALRGEAAASGIEGRVIFTGYRRDVAELMNACDVLVHASRWPEPFGMTVLEAMALAKPVVASGLGGPAETIEDGVSGLLFPPKDPAALARAIDSVLADPELAERLGQAASERLERHFSLDSHVAKVERLYEAVLAGGAAQAAAQQAAAWQPVKR